MCVCMCPRGLSVLTVDDRAICQRRFGTAFPSCAHIASPRLAEINRWAQSNEAEMSTDRKRLRVLDLDMKIGRGRRK